MAGTETTAAEKWLYETLHNDATILAVVSHRIYSYQAPQGTAFPYIVFELSDAPRDVVGVGARRIWSNLYYVVRVVWEGQGMAAYKSTVARIDTLLHARSGTSNSDGHVLGCVRESPVSYVEDDDGRRYNHQGGLYRLWAQ